MTPSSQRPIPLQGRPDLVVAVNDFQGVAYWVIKDPVALKYHRLRGEQYHVLTLLNRERSIEGIRDELRSRMPTLHLTLSDVQNLVTDLHNKGLVQSHRMGQAGSLVAHHRKEKKKKLLGSLKNIMYLRLPGWDPETTLNWMYPYFSWIFKPWAVAACITFVVASWLLLAIQFDTFQSRLPEFSQFFGWPNLVFLWVTLGISKVIHEFGHGLSCKHYGGECHEMGVMLLVFSPCLYCDVSDSWMLKNKWQRIIIAAAGMYIEIVLSALAIFIWWNTRPGLVHHLAMNVFFVTTISTVIFNANPLMRFDGYYMMSDLLEIPNLRPKAEKLLRESFGWYCLGIESRPDPFMPETGRHWFILYAVAAWLYRWVILVSITVFLYTVLKPYGLESVGIFLAVVSISGIFISMGTNLYRMVTAPREEPMSKLKTSFTVLFFVTIIAVVLAIPIPWHLESELVVEPLKAEAVYNQTPGQLIKFEVQPGDEVVEDQVIARLSNPDLEDERRDLLNKIAVQRVDIDLQEALDNMKTLAQSRLKLSLLQDQLKDVESRLADLEIVAPIAGVIVESPRRPEPSLDKLKESLPQWHGAPTDPENENAFFQERTHLLSIAPYEELEAVVVVDQANRNFIRKGMDVTLKFEHLPDMTFDGEIAEISRRHLEFAPEALSNKLGGETATVTDSEGREKLASNAYQATVQIAENEELMIPGLRGKARVTVAERTAGQWLWRYLRQTIYFKL